MKEEKIVKEIEEKALEFSINKDNFAWGVDEASYLAGFASTLTSTMPLSQEIIKDIIIAKMQCEYEKILHSMTIDSNEFVTKMYAEKIRGEMTQPYDEDDE